MDIYLDHDEFACAASTLRGIIDAATAALEARRRIVVEVRVDGETLGGEALAAQLDQAVTCEELQLVTADPQSLAIDTLEQVRDALAAARAQQREAAEQLSTDHSAEAMANVRAVLGVWQQAQQSVESAARLLDVSLDELRAGDEPAPQVIGDLVGRLGMIRDQLAARDWLGLADSLAYELDESTAQWLALLDEMCRVIRATPAE